MEESVKCGIVGAVEHPQVDYTQVIYSHYPWSGEPAQSINYASSHDNLTLWDKLTLSRPRVGQEKLQAMHKLSAAIVLLSQGIPFLHAGVEFLRTKQGDRNSYKSPDKINQLHWCRKERYLHIFHYFQGLIALRKAHPAFR